MPYLLMAAVAAILVLGLAKLNGARSSSNNPWRPMLVWAVLLVAGIAIWLSSDRIG